ncbi:glycosyltransferase family 4 protein [Novosphingobium sediminicola]|nr:glycosyltransferase family 4 protein [Novosphingobium sediminicola]
MGDQNSGNPPLGEQTASHEVVPFLLRHSMGARRLRVALVGTYAPRSCGIATFSADVREQLMRHAGGMDIDVYALDGPDSGLVYAQDVHVIGAQKREDYLRAAHAINDSCADVVWIQHEFGIFGGTDGALISELVDRLAAPVLITFHTVLAKPSPGQRAVMEHLLSRCSRVMVMSQQGRQLLMSTYRAPGGIIEVIEHGAPDRPFRTAQKAKHRMGLAGKKVLTTFGLLGPGKGLETAIAAMPAILREHSDTVYRIVGATHPVLVARDGESYRQGLMAQAEALGVSHAILWDNRFLAIEDLLEQLECCDIYLSPYPGLDQSTSGTLSYAVALGKAVVSTPYVHARELLADGVGCLIEPNAPDAIAAAVNDLLFSPQRLLELQRRAYERGRRTTWPHFARASAHLVRNTLAARPQRVEPAVVPELAAVWNMSDGTGMLQHAVGPVPDRRHGYCTDDNARALMLMNVAKGITQAERMRWSGIYGGFLFHAWNPDARRFRNFMRFDRQWCEDVGSQDSNGRALWALGHTVEHSPIQELRNWAGRMVDDVMPRLNDLDAPRALAFGALGCCALLRGGWQSAQANERITLACETLTRLVTIHRRPDWLWFEQGLAYDNPRLSQALIEGGVMLGRREWVDAGLETLAWIMDCQTSAQGFFRPVGSESFDQRGLWKPFDQQPLEAQAAVEAARAAWMASGDEAWVRQAHQAYQWFFGANDRGVAVADIASGRCCDGVTPRGRNENSGAESILAFHLSHYALAAMNREARPYAKAGTDLGNSTG